MAVGLDVVEKTLEDLEKEVTCAVCQELYTDPRILPCLHCYCKQCILNISLKAQKNRSLSCPECRKDTSLPDGGVEELRSAFIINRLKSMYLKHKKALSKQAQCEMCKSEDSAVIFCKQCDKFACKNCEHMHTVMSAVFDGHEIVPIDQLQTVKTKQLVLKNLKHYKCQTHNKSLKIFCFDCNKLICRDCTVKDHKDHDIEFNNVAANSKKKELVRSLKPLKEIEDSLSGSLEMVHNTECEVEAQGDSIANTIKTCFEEFHLILETRKQQLLEEAKKRVKEKIENLKGQEKNLSIASAGVRSVIDYTEQYVRHCSDEEVMSMHTEISRRIQDEVEEHSKPENRLEPIEVADMGVVIKCAEDLQQLCQKARITCPMDYIVVNNMPSTAELDKEIKIEVIDINKNPTKSSLHLQSQVKCVPTGAVIKPEIEVKMPDRSQISYTPSVHGQYELSIRAYGQPVPGSPFTMNVYMSPTQLDQPVKVWGGFSEPFSIAVNSIGEIIVAERNKDIKVLNNEGKILRRIEHPQHKISWLRSISVDTEDSIYFIGEESNKIGKANKNCDIVLVRDIQVKQVKQTGYIDIAAVGDEVMVTEYDNDGYIMVYDRELNYVRQITSCSNAKLRCLCPDHNKNLYISDNHKNIQVFSITGNFIQFFSRDHFNGVPQFSNPWMVHVCGQHVFVADSMHHKTVVFTIEGNYVTKFGCWGDISFDQDGVLWTGDYHNSIVAGY